MKHPLKKPAEPTVAALLAAIRVINEYHDLGDAVYNVRENHGGDDGFTGDSWTHPKVIAYSRAVEDLRDMGALEPLPATQTAPEMLIAELIGEAFNNYRFQVREASKDGRSYVAEVSIREAGESEAATWWGEHGNQEMARFEAVRWAEGQALQMAARAFAQ